MVVLRMHAVAWRMGFWPDGATVQRFFKSTTVFCGVRAFVDFVVMMPNGVDFSFLFPFFFLSVLRAGQLASFACALPQILCANTSGFIDVDPAL